MSACWLNGKIVPNEAAVVSVFDHGLLYGDGVFEGIRFYNQQPFLLQEHLDRLFDSAAALLLTMPFTRDELTRGITEVIHAFAKADGYLRLVITRGPGKLGVDPRLCPRPSVFIIADQLQVVSNEIKTSGLRVVVVSTRRIPNVSWDARIKSLNYLNNVLAKLEAHNANADEAIMLNHAGNIAEGSVDNIFIVRNGKLLTPPTIDGALAGITRGLILQLAKDEHISTAEQSLTPFDLYSADECFLTGTGMELVPVREVDGRVLRHCPGPIFTKLQQAFSHFVAKQSGYSD